MARTRIEIRYPEKDMVANRARMEACRKFQYVDRPPVLLGIEARYTLDVRGIGWDEYFSDPYTQMYHQLLNQKWILENIPDDRCTAPGVWVWPDWQNIVNASGAGCEIIFSNDETPRARPFLFTPEDVHAYEPRDHTSGLWGKRLEWYRQMMDLRSRFQVIFNGEEVEIGVGLGINGDSPFMTALDMAQDHFLLWLVEAPEVAHELMHKLTESYIRVETHYRTLRGVPIGSGFGLSDDPVGMLSLKTYREMIVPYTKRLYDVFAPPPAPRGMHLCGKNYHVIDALVDDLHVTSMDGYGSPNPPEAYVERMAGRVVLAGNIDPMLLLNGPPSEIRAACSHLLDVLGPYGGVILEDGFNVCPGTPIEHLAILREVAIEYGRTHVPQWKERLAQRG